MDVDFEIHVPGLDLDRKRWNQHILFMEEVHANLSRILAFAQEQHATYGRGTLYVDERQWMSVIEGSWKEHQSGFPCRYVTVDEAREVGELEMLRDGFKQLLREYDPSQQLVLTVKHHRSGLLSTYLLRRTAETEEGGA